jgi:hypothetical protein
MRYFEISGLVPAYQLQNIRSAFDAIEITWGKYGHDHQDEDEFLVTLEFECRDCDVATNLIALTSAGMFGESREVGLLSAGS